MTDDASTLPHGALDVAPGVRIPSSELDVQAITGSGPGGQHVNRSATRIVLRWNVQRTGALTDEQRTRLDRARVRRPESLPRPRDTPG